MSNDMLAQFVDDFAPALARVDATGPQAIGLVSKKAYQPGIGPHTEAQTVALVMAEMVAEHPDRYEAHQIGVPYPRIKRQRCDLCLGDPPDYSLAFEAKMLRLFGDNGKLNDNMLMHILSPYPEHRSALTDCDKLVNSGFTCPTAVVIFGYDYPGWPMDPAIDGFEALARLRVKLGERATARYDGLVHPVHQRGRVFAWEVASG